MAKSFHQALAKGIAHGLRVLTKRKMYSWHCCLLSLSDIFLSSWSTHLVYLFSLISIFWQILITMNIKVLSLNSGVGRGEDYIEMLRKLWMQLSCKWEIVGVGGLNVLEYTQSAAHEGCDSQHKTHTLKHWESVTLPVFWAPVLMQARTPPCRKFPESAEDFGHCCSLACAWHPRDSCLTWCFLTY